MDTNLPPMADIDPRTIPLPPGAVLTPSKPEEQHQKGWWSLRDLSGALARVLEAVDGSAIPEHWKIVIKADVTKLCGSEFNFVELDAHYFVDNGQATLHLSIDVQKKLL